MRFPILILLAACCWGCGEPADPNIPREYALVPAGGEITLDGKPLAGAVVTFLQTDEEGTTCSADTDEMGQYELSYRGETGAAAAHYKVAVSYKVSPDGRPLSRNDRMVANMDNGAHLAREQVPPEYSNLGKTELTATIPPQGGRFNFPLKGPLLPPRPVENPDPAPAAKPAGTAPAGN